MVGAGQATNRGHPRTLEIKIQRAIERQQKGLFFGVSPIAAAPPLRRPDRVHKPTSVKAL
jgi:hypothetical protein